MRKGIDYIGVGVGAIIQDDAGRFFLSKRGKDVRNESGKWEFPGGAVEFNETMAAALVREVREEYGFTISVLSLLDVVDHIIPLEKQHWISPSFLCVVETGSPVIREPHKCDAIGWFSLDEIPEQELTLASRKSLESLRHHLAKNGEHP